MNKEEKKMTVRDILNAIYGDTILYVKNINEKRGAVLLCKNMELYCSDKLLDLHVKKLSIGDYEIKGDGIELGKKWVSRKSYCMYS